jgi:hypothetical protein
MVKINCTGRTVIRPSRVSTIYLMFSGGMVTQIINSFGWKVMSIPRIGVANAMAIVFKLNKV